MSLLTALQEFHWQEFILEQATIWLSVFIVDTLRYLLGAGIVSLVLYGILAKWSKKRKIQNRKANWLDVRREIGHSFVTISVYASVTLFIIEAHGRGWLLLYERVADYGWLYTLLSLPLVLVLHDSYFYWVHRAMHLPLFFRRVHHIHHLSRTPTPWAAYSFSIFEAMVMVFFIPLILALLPLHKDIVIVFLAIMILRNAMGHSGIEFHHQNWVHSPCDIFTTTTHHDMHHQNFKGNFGLYFTWWDRLMKTELPNYKQEFAKAVSKMSS